MNKKKTIGLLGLAFGSTNKGCEALGYGFLNVLERVAKEMNVEFEIHIFENCDVDLIYSNGNYSHLKIQSVSIPGLRSISKIKEIKKLFKNCDSIFDFTAGDSFSDIYGMKRFLQRSFIKVIAEKSGTSFILGSQTYGPFDSFIAKQMASSIIKKATAVYARDSLSCDRIKKLTKRNAVLTVDVAFAMQYTPIEIKSDRIKIGFNPSGLLWQGGYTQSNQFGLTVDYKKYCKNLIRKLIASGKYEVYLIPHVISDNLLELDNDIVACRELKQEFDQLKESIAFATPVEVKSYISGMDVFVGARMHATIAAFTTGVPVIPFSYSPKFEGLFSSLGYNHVISATKISTDDAVNKTLHMIDEKDIFAKELVDLKPVIDDGIAKLINETKKILF